MIDNIMNIEERPDELEGQTIKVDTACGNMFVTINTTENYPIFEVFAASGKTGSCSAAFVDALTRTISIGLRAGVDPDEIIEQIINIRCPKSNSKKSCPEAIAQVMKDYLEENFTEIVIEIEEFENELEKGEDDDYEYYWEKNSESDVNYDTEIEVEVNTTEGATTDNCPECGSSQFNPAAEGCAICLDCGFSPCG